MNYLRVAVTIIGTAHHPRPRHCLRIGNMEIETWWARLHWTLLRSQCRQISHPFQPNELGVISFWFLWCSPFKPYVRHIGENGINRYSILGTIPHSESNGFTRSFKRDARENIISDESDKSSFQHQDVILGVNESQSKLYDPANKDILASRAEDGAIGQDTNEAATSGNG